MIQRSIGDNYIITFNFKEAMSNLPNTNTLEADQTIYIWIKALEEFKKKTAHKIEKKKIQ